MRCKNCNQKFEPKRFLQKYCDKEECSYEAIKITLKKVRQIKAKDEKERSKKMKIEAKEPNYKKALQDEINKLARMIDKKFGYDYCIDCNRKMTGQIDAAHYHSRGKNNSLRYNLHNLHSANGFCNQYDEKHLGGYKIGLIERYGKKYCDYVLNDLPVLYKEIHLNAFEIKDKLTIVRKLIREFDNYIFDSSIKQRDEFNKLIAIYNK